VERFAGKKRGACGASSSSSAIAAAAAEGAEPAAKRRTGDASPAASPSPRPAPAARAPPAELKPNTAAWSALSVADIDVPSIPLPPTRPLAPKPRELTPHEIQVAGVKRKVQAEHQEAQRKERERLKRMRQEADDEERRLKKEEEDRIAEKERLIEEERRRYAEIRENAVRVSLTEHHDSLQLMAELENTAV